MMGVNASAHPNVEVIESDMRHANRHFSCTRRTIRKLDQAQHFWAAMMFD
jgi:hypothetical protein